MPAKFSKRIALIGIALLYLGLVVLFEVTTAGSERLTRTGYGYPLIYGNGPYSTYGRGTDANGALQPLPTIGGKSYDVVYHHYTFLLGMGLGLQAVDMYYLVPQRAIETLPQPPCRAGNRPTSILATTSCIDLRSVSGTSLIATVNHPGIVALEAVVMGIIPIGVVLWVWRKYCR